MTTIASKSPSGSEAASSRRLDEHRALGALEAAAREIAWPMIGHGHEPAELRRHADERYRVEPAAEHEQLRDRLQRRVENSAALLGRQTAPRRSASRHGPPHASSAAPAVARAEHALAGVVGDGCGPDGEVRPPALDDRRHAGRARAREPFCDGAEWLVVVGPEQRLQEDSKQPVAADAEPPELVGGVAQIVGNGGSLPTLRPRRAHVRRDLPRGNRR